MSDQRPHDDTPRPEAESAEERPRPFTYRAQRQERLRRAREGGRTEAPPREEEARRLDGCREPEPREPPHESGPLARRRGPGEAGRAGDAR